MIKEAFVSFEVAKLLKEKGFVESCYGRYSVRSKDFHLDTTKPCNNGSNFLYCAPTHQMAMAWLRENGIIIEILHVTSKPSNDGWFYSYQKNNDSETNLIEYPSYEDAVETALKYVLKNLI